MILQFVAIGRIWKVVQQRSALDVFTEEPCPLLVLR